MTCYDVFNGDADGICALQQLRLQTPKQAQLITGLKREISLLARISAKAGDDITVLDISMEKNRQALDRVLEAGATVFYADHHYPGEIPEHDRLSAHIDVEAETCTSLIVNQYLEGAHARWAVVGAYGDNFDRAASRLGRSIGLDKDELSALQQLGICLNYNGYGLELDDVMYHAADLYESLKVYQNPGDYLNDEPGFKALLKQYQTDRRLSENIRPETDNEIGAVYRLPNEAWARRIVGIMGNELAKMNPDRAHALLIDTGDGGYRVSVRAPYNRKQGADVLCRQFETGGGRKAAAGINRLASHLLPEFLEKFHQVFELQK